MAVCVKSVNDIISGRYLIARSNRVKYVTTGLVPMSQSPSNGGGSAKVGIITHKSNFVISYFIIRYSVIPKSNFVIHYSVIPKNNCYPLPSYSKK